MTLQNKPSTSPTNTQLSISVQIPVVGNMSRLHYSEKYIFFTLHDDLESGSDHGYPHDPVPSTGWHRASNLDTQLSFLV